MSEQIGRGVIELSADSSKLNAAIGEARRSIKDLGTASAQSNARSSASIDRHVRSLQTQVAVQGKSSREAELYKLALRGASDEQLRAANSALKLSEAHKRGDEIGARLRTTFLALGAAAATGLVAAVVAFDRLIAQAGNFQDLSEKTGDTAENIASLALAAGTAGASMDSVVGASIKLTKGLTGVDDETKAAGAAIAALGLNLADFKRLSPTDQLEAVAKALAGFEDGAGKTAVALALFGKAGADLLPFLRELGAEGGRQTILTQAQIQAADAHADAQAKLRTEIGLYAQAIATQALPQLNLFTGALRDLVKDQQFAATASDLLRGALGAVTTVFQTLAVIGSDVGFVFKGVGREIGAIAAQIGLVSEFRPTPEGIEAFGRKWRSISEGVRDDGAKARAELDRFQARVMSIGSPQALPTADAKLKAPPLRRLSFSGAVKDGNAGANQAQQEAQRIADTYKRLKQGIEDYIGAQQAEIANQGPLSAARREHIEAIKQIERSGLDEGKKLELLRDADRARSFAEEKEAQAARLKGNDDLAASRAREEEAARAETAQIREGNRAVEEQIALMNASLQTQALVERAKLRAVITDKQARLAMLRGFGTGTDTEQLEEQIALLERREARIAQSAAEQSDPWFRAAESIRRYGEEASNVGEQIGQAMDRGFQSAEDALVRFTMTGKLGFREFASSIIADIARIQARQAISQATSSAGGFLGKLIGTVLPALVPGGGAGSGINLTFGQQLATGTNYVPRDNFPALLHRGEAVVPAKYNPAAGGGEPITIINQTTGRIDQAQETRLPSGERAIIIREAVIAARRDRAGALADPNSRDSRAMQRNFDVARTR